MKKYLLSLFAFVPWLAQAQAPAQSPAPMAFTIKGTIGKLNAPAKIYLIRPAIMDSATLKNGVFELKGTTDMPKEMELILCRTGNLRMEHLWQHAPEAKDRLKFFIEPGPVVLTSPDSLNKATVKGSSLTTDYQKLQASLKPVDVKEKVLEAEYRKASEEERQAPAFKQRMEAQEAVLSQEWKQRCAAFIKANPNSWVSLDLLQKIGEGVPQYAEVAPLYAALSPAMKSTQPGREYGEMLQAIKNVAVGAQAPNFAQQTPEGKTVSLADYRGKYVLVDFWASWCRPCREENPVVTKVYNEYKGKNFDILSVSLDSEKSREKWLKAIKDDQLTWTQVSDLQGWQNAVATQYHVQAIPQNFLVDPNGKIVAVNLRGDKLKAELGRYIK